MMRQYRKLPVVIDAVLWDGTAEMLEELRAENPFAELSAVDGTLQIKTIEGVVTAGADGGWYVIRGVKGELYPCREDIFKSTYEPVVDGDEPFASVAMPTAETALEVVLSLGAVLALAKPNDRSELDRHFAIARTETDKLEAYIRTFLVGEGQAEAG